MPLPEGVIHLPEDGFQRRVAPIAEEHAQRVESPAEQARHGEKANRPSIHGDTRRRHRRLYLPAQANRAAVATVPAMK
ncbi:hypothetical protein D3C86_1224920 [compost metagenome]